MAKSKFQKIQRHLTVLILILSSCSHQKPETTTLTIAMSSDPIELDPRGTYLCKDISIAKALYEGLVRESTQGIQLALAESYTLSEDQKVYTFKLKPSLWSNGDPLTAYDFEESLKQLHSEGFSPSVHTLLRVIKNSFNVSEHKLPLEDLGIYAKDALTLEITLETPLSHFLEIIAHPVFYPVHTSLRNYYNTPLANVPQVSNGPFILKKYQPQNYLELKANPHYYDRQVVHLNTIILKIIPNLRTALKLLNNHTVDWIGSPWSSVLDKETQRALPEEVLHSYPVLSTTLLIYNFQKPLIQNKAFRKAIAHALNKEVIVQLVNQGKVAQSLVPPLLSYLPSPHPLTTEERQKKAQAYFAQAKEQLSDKELSELSLLYPLDSNNFTAIAQEIQQQIKQVLGLHITIQGTEYHNFLKHRKHGNFFIATGGWVAEYPSPVSFLAILGNPYDLTKWQNDEYANALATLYTTNGNTEILQIIETIVEQETPIIPLYHSNHTYAINRKIHNIFDSPLGYVDLKKVAITE
ncbi:peptide ABC transporter substrate-binding protein [Candidatus Chlamydia sanziniae]|uniref:Oligopeptide ABC transporter, periplasmic oligopeptide-binding protein OppA n=1 Tax=Candidatus Chlamydia sanziniae TaxID=1806891 RepID=A0A1A9HY40_9CHLA|nr:peptide ABC transporter substrate-binding protein [Candidatus Chlamydia sanziniae]ANH78954.1 Oligopeptide ABC transporter, periplasmic oligopeptide-binding protein OppA [Candidatus Chlamydia sanziniae]